jgi:hypothetical protein
MPPPSLISGTIHPERILMIAERQSGDSKEEAPAEERVELAPHICFDLPLASTSLSPSERNQVEALLRRNLAVFPTDSSNSSHTTLFQHRIDTGSNPPVHVPPYRVGPAQQAEIDEHVKQMTASGVISMSQSPYSSPVLLVHKSDGTKRFCVDFRRLNSITKRDVYPLPRVDDMLDALGKACYFTTLDLQTGFWQIPIFPDDKEKTAFSTYRGHYQFNYMPFGLTNAPATFQRMMDSLLREHKDFCLVYMDDIIVFSISFDLHKQHLQLVFDRLRYAELVLKPSKCKLFRSEVKFLGHIIGHNSVKPDPEHVAAVYSFPTPTTVKQLQAFLGLVGYYRRFVPHLAAIAAPLYQLLKKHQHWRWRDYMEQRAMDDMKAALTSPPLLRPPNWDLPFILQTDACDTGIGAVLSQRTSKPEAGDTTTLITPHAGPATTAATTTATYLEHPIYYASKSLNSAQRSYSVTDRELLAVKWAVRLFHHYLYRHPFIIYTDHAALQWLLQAKNPNSRQTRVALELQGHDYSIVQRPGSENGNADAMSRLPALLESQSSLHQPAPTTSPSQPRAELIAAVTTRSANSKLPQTHRAGMDPSYALDPRAYDVFAAVADSLSTAGSSAASTEGVATEGKVVEEAKLEVPDSADEQDTSTGTSIPGAHTVVDEQEQQTEWLATQRRVDESMAGTVLTAAQHEDHDLLPYLTYLDDPTTTSPIVTSAIRSSAHAYAIQGGVLYKQAGDSARVALGRQAYLPVIPKSLRAMLLHEYHDSPSSAHLGEVKTYERLADLYYWKGMAADIKQYVSSCVKCAQRKSPNKQQRLQNIPLLSLPFPAKPFEALGIDVLGPLPRTSTGYKYVLVITDHFTRWPMAFPMRDQKSATIATLLVERVFCEHGYPATLLSDQGSNFLSDLLAAVLKLFAVKKLTTSAYHPQTNGLTERFNHTLCTMLSHYSNSHTNNWDTYLPYVLFAYRTAPQSTTKSSPYYLLYGRQPLRPIDYVLFPTSAQLQSYEQMDSSAQAEYMLNLSERLRQAHELVTRAASNTAENRQQHMDHMADTHSIPSFDLNALVLLYQPAIRKHTSKKLTAQWSGPYMVVQALDNRVNYIIQKCNERGELNARNKPYLVHISRLKAYVVHMADGVRAE